MEFKLLSDEEIKQLFDSGQIGGTKIQALLKAQQAYDIKQIVEWGNELCKHHSLKTVTVGKGPAFGVPKKKHECTDCWAEMARELGKKLKLDLGVPDEQQESRQENSSE